MTLYRRILICAAVVLAANAGCGNSQKAETKKASGGQGSGHSSTAAKGGAKTTSGKSTGSSATGTKGTAAGTGSAKSASAAGAKSTGHKNAGGWFLTEADNGKYLQLHPGDLVLVKLRASRGNGYQWVMRDTGGSALRREGDPVYTPAASKKGNGGDTGTESWKFRAVKPGEQTVRLEYLPPWSKDVPERALRFTVAVR